MVEAKAAGSEGQGLRSRVSLAVYLNGMNLLVLILTTIVISRQAIELLKDSKYRDIVVILYNDSQNLGRLLNDDFLRMEKLLTAPDNPPRILRRQEGQKNWLNVRGFSQDSLNDEELGLDAEQLKLRFVFTEINGSTFFIQPSSRAKVANGSQEILLYPIKWDQVSANLNQSKTDSLNYILNRSGKMLFSSDPSLSAFDLKRPLVKAYVDSLLSTNQMEIEDSKSKRPSFGSFVQIPESNLILFTETPRDLITREVNRVRFQFAIYSAITISLALLGLILINHNLTAALADLLSMIEKIKAGIFDSKPTHFSFGEVNRIQHLFVAMSQSLIDRDKRISNLIVAERQSALLQNELDIASEIQTSFLPKRSAEQLPGLMIDSIYIPSGMVAGDWFGEYYEQSTQRFFAIIADVSGHGAGPAMYTAMLAGLFEQARSNDEQSMDPERILKSINSVFYNIGQTQWHVTAMFVVIDLRLGKLKIFNSGHLPPILLIPEADAYKRVSLTLGSDPLGLMPQPSIAHKELELVKGMSLLLYTDGITEGKNAKGDVFGKKNLMTIFTKNIQAPPQKQLSQIKSEFQAHINSIRGEDDVCAIAIKYLGS